MKIKITYMDGITQTTECDDWRLHCGMLIIDRDVKYTGHKSIKRTANTEAINLTIIKSVKEL